MRNKILTTVIVLFYINPPICFTQNISLSGFIKSHAQKPIAYASIGIFRDSISIKSLSADSLGHFSIFLRKGNYKFKITAIGFRDFEDSLICNEKKNLTIELIEISKQLDEIIVTTKKSFIERKLNKVIVNIESSITASDGTALDALSKSPGVSINSDANILLNGKGGVLIQLNEKKIYLSGDRLADFLRGMPASNISNIEIIKNPSAKYDAEGSSGIININLKKNISKGLTNSIYVSGSQGVYSKLITGTNGGYKSGISNWNWSYDYVNRKDFRQIKSTRLFTTDSKITIFDQSGVGDRNKEGNNFRVSNDISISKKSFLEFEGLLSLSKSFRNFDNNTEVINQQFEVDSVLKTHIYESNNIKTMSFNVNYKYLIDTLGSEIQIGGDYFNHLGNNNNEYLTNFYRVDNTLLNSPIGLKTLTPSDVQIYTVKIDLVKKLTQKTSLEVGFKSSFIQNNNQISFERLKVSNWIEQKELSNQFDYQENTNSAYLNLSKESEKWNFIAGIRGEQTYIVGNSLTLNQINKQSYLKLFPNIFIQKKWNEDNSLSITYGKRIDRPTYDILNPFIQYIDSYNNVQGNATLKPEYSHNFDLTYNYHAYSLSFFGSITEDFITQIPQQDNITKKTTIIFSNFDKFYQYGIQLSVPFSIGSKFESNNTFEAFENDYNAKINSMVFSNRATAFSFNTNNSFKVNKNLNYQLDFAYESSTIEGIYKTLETYNLSLGIQSSFYGKKLKVSLSANDILRGLIIYSSVESLGQTFKETYRKDTQYLTLRINYKFTKGDKIAKREKDSSKEDERKRLKEKD